MKIYGFDHVEYYVGDLAAASRALRASYGFTIGGRSPAHASQRSLLLRQGQIRLLLTAPVTEDDPAARFIARHGDGIGVIAFRTDDVRQAHAEIVAAGARSIAEPEFASSGDGPGAVVGTSVVAGFGDVLHKLVERSDPDGDFAPGVIELADDEIGGGAGGEVGGDKAGPLLYLLDHVAVCLPAGNSTRP